MARLTVMLSPANITCSNLPRQTCLHVLAAVITDRQQPIHADTSGEASCYM